MASPPTERPRIGGVVPRFSWGPALIVLVVLGLTGWSAQGVGFDLVELVGGTGPIEKFISQMFPPDLSARTLQTAGKGILETFQMSFLGTLIGAVISVPLAAVATGDASTAGEGSPVARAASGTE